MHTLPPPPRHRFGALFVGLARRWRRALDDRLSGVGLTDATWAPLVHLEMSGGGISQTELAGMLGIDGSTLVRLLDILAGKGLIERRPDPVDRRAKRLHLTQAGHDAVVGIRAVIIQAETEMLADLDDATLAALIDTFDLIDARIRAMRPHSGTPQQ